MPDQPAARDVTRRLAFGVLAAAFVLAGLAAAALAHAVTGARIPPPAAQPAQPAQPASQTQPRPPASLPGLTPPRQRPDRSSGTTASGPVRAAPAHMPFYVATKGQTTLYLLGTLHVGYPDDYPADQPFRKPVLAALDASPTLALEISPDDMLVSQDDVTRYGMCRSACLIDYLPDAMWKQVEARMRAHPGAVDQISHTRPWLASMLVETYDTVSAGLQSEYGSEAQLQNVYLRARGKVVGLETLAEQMSTFTRLTSAQQREMLAQDLVQTPAENVADVKELHRLWRIGDADALKAWDDAKTEKLARSKSVAALVDSRVVYERNRRFVTRMLQIAAPNKPVFVAIGALHLGGRRGVLELLRQRGFVVEPA